MVYTSSQALRAGVPLGGIGAGKVELDNRGKLINATFLNNWNMPLPLVRGFHIFVNPEEIKGFFMETNLPFINYGVGCDLQYEGMYPFVSLSMKKGDIRAYVTAFSALVPGDILNSSLPAFGLEVTVVGSKRGQIAVSFPNLMGLSPIGRINEGIRNGFLMKNDRAKELDPSQGESCLISQDVEVIPQYSFSLDQAHTLQRGVWNGIYESPDPWLAIEYGQRVKGETHEVTGLWDDPAGMPLANYESNETTKFVFSWYMKGRSAGYPYGHYYAREFKGALDVAKYFLEEFNDLRKKTEDWQLSVKDALSKRGLDSWISDAVLNSAYVLSSNSWLDEKGRFSLLEAPERTPLQGTLAGLCYEAGSLPVALMFPELDRSYLELMANSMRRDGYVPHDLGLLSMDDPTDGTTAPPPWKDTNPTFVLLVYRHYLIDHDMEFLRDMYPSVVRAVVWEAERDNDLDGIPELEGTGDSAFDALPMSGASSYVASLYIASLLALREMAAQLHDDEGLRYATDLLTRARKGFDAMFDGKKFKAWSGNPQAGSSTFAGQLIGQWWAKLLGFEDVTEGWRVSSALNAIAESNGRASNYCVPNLVGASNLGPQTTSSWPRLTFANAWLGFELDMPQWVALAKKEWDNLVRQGLVWNQPSRIDGETGRPEPENYLDHYVGNASIWSFVFQEMLHRRQ